MDSGSLASLGFRNDGYVAIGPIVTVSFPTPSTSHSSLSPTASAPTPAGVPVRITSPAASATD